MIGIRGAREGGGIRCCQVSLTSKCRSFWQAAKKRLADNCIFGLSVATLSRWLNYVHRSAGQRQTLFKQHCNASENALFLGPILCPCFVIVSGRSAVIFIFLIVYVLGFLGPVSRGLSTVCV